MKYLIVFGLIHLTCIHWIAASPISDTPIKSIKLSQLNSTDPVNVIAKKVNRTTFPSNKSALTNAKDFLQGLRDKISGMEDVEKKLDVIVKSLDNTNAFYFPKGTQNYDAQKYYQRYDYAFIGWGCRASQDSEAIVSGANTIRACIIGCYGKRLSDNTYNGINFYHAGSVGNRCYCCKNEAGHSESNDHLHYRYISVH